MKPALSAMIKSGAVLALLALAGSLLLAIPEAATRGKIVAQERRAVLSSLNQVVPAGTYNNELQDDFFDLPEHAFFQHRDPVRIYRARRDGQDRAVIMQVTAPDGYNGDIIMLVAIGAEARLLGVRVLDHSETPGLGDGMEPENSDWIKGFSGKSLDEPGSTGWDVRRHGGYFDQFTGATITPRAIVHAVKRSLEYFSAHRDRLFDHPSQGGVSANEN